MELPQLSKVSSEQNFRRKEQAGTPKIEMSRRNIDSLKKSDEFNELNNCEFYNQKQRHLQALNHAESAIQIIEMELQKIKSKIEVAPNSLSDGEKQHFLERTSLLSIAYYNKGCECEHLDKILKATQAYSTAVNLQSSRQGNQILLKQFKLSLKQARIKLKQQMIQQTTTESKEASSSKSPIQKRPRPSSARLDFNFAQQQQYGKNITDIKEVERPQSEFHNFEVMENLQSKQYKHGVENQNQSVVKQSANFLMNSFGSGFDKVQDFDHESLRKTVISEIVAVDNLSEYTQTQQQVLNQMIPRPPKNNQESQQRLRGVRQASQRPQQAAEQIRQKHGRNFSHTQQTSPNPPLQQTFFQVVDEVLSSMETGPGKFQNNSHKLYNQSKSPEKFNINPSYQLKLQNLVRIFSLWRRRKIMKAVKLALALQRIKNDSKKLALLIKVQQLFRRRKMIKLIKQTQWLYRISKDSKKVQMVIKIQSLFRRRKIIKVIKPALWLHRIQKDPKKVKMVIKVQSLFRRRKVLRVVRLALLKRRIQQDQHLMDKILKIQRLWRRKKFLNDDKLALAKRRVDQNTEQMANLPKIQALFRKRKSKQVVIAAVAQNADRKTEPKAAVELQKQVQISSVEKTYKQDPKYEQAAKKIQSMFRRRKLILALTKSLEIKQANQKKAQTSFKNVIHKKKIQSIAVSAFKDTKSTISTLEAAALHPKTKKKLAQQVQTLGNKIITVNLSQQQQVLKAVRLIQSWYRRRKLRLAFLRAMPIIVKTIKHQGCYYKVVVAINDQQSLLVKVTSLPGNRQSQELIVNLPTNQNIQFFQVDFAQEIVKKLSIDALGKARILTDEEILSFENNRNHTGSQEKNEKAHATFGKNTKNKLSTLQLKNILSSSITELPISRDQIFQKSTLSHKRVEKIIGSQSQKKVIRLTNNSIQSSNVKVTKPNPLQKSSQKVSFISQKNLSVSSSQQLLASQLNKPSVSGHVSMKPKLKLVKTITTDSKKELLKQHSQQLLETSKSNSTHKQLKKKHHTLNSNHKTYRIKLEADGMQNIQVHFQPAIVMKKSLVLVTLLNNQEAIDRKILPLDIYSGAMAFDLFDLDQFCKDQIMPCLQIKERKIGSFLIEVNETKLAALLKQCDLDKEVPQKNAVQQEKIQLSKNISEQTFNSEIFKKSNSINTQSYQKKLTGQFTLIKRNQTIDDSDYNLQVNFDVDTHTMQFTVEKMNATLTLNLVNSAATPRELADLHEKAEEICKQLIICNNRLQLRKASHNQLRDDQVVFRTGKSIQGSFYIVSLGLINSLLIVDAYDKANEKHLVLRLEWNSKTELLQKDACKLIDKLDVMELAGNQMLVIR